MSPLSRRRVLVAVAGVVAVVLGYVGFGPRIDGPLEGEMTDRPAWERAADERIREHRTAALDVVVVDGAGDPVPDAAVTVEMQRHRFGFGTAVNADYFVEETEEGDEYRRRIRELFNKAVLENHHKWGFWEQPDERERAEETTRWLLDNGLTVRGHTCIWQRRNEGAIPADVDRAIDRGDGEHISRRARRHIADVVGHYRAVDGFTEWDVLNEPVAEQAMTAVVDPAAPSGRAPELLAWMAAARRADPDARLFVNEFNVLVGDDEEKRDAFEATVEYLLDNGADVGGLGLQGHHSTADQRRTPAELLDTLDRFAALGPALQVHEYDTWGDDWDEDEQGEYFAQFLKTVFSHPATVGFLMWGFWDEIHWQGNAPLFRADWSPKPAYDVYVDLVFDEWWTDESGRTGSDGVHRTRAFLGEHLVTVRTPEGETTATVTVETPDATTVTVSVGG